MAMDKAWRENNERLDRIEKKLEKMLTLEQLTTLFKEMGQEEKRPIPTVKSTARPIPAKKSEQS